MDIGRHRHIGESHHKRSNRYERVVQAKLLIEEDTFLGKEKGIEQADKEPNINNNR